MLEYFSQKKKDISAFLDNFFGTESEAYRSSGRFGTETLERLKHFALRGKMIRGGLVLLGHELYNGSCPEDAVAIAAALELFQSALLIHDDIMDRDTSRRGKPTVFFQYADEFEKTGISDHVHIGEAMGICVGDISFFCAFTILSQIQADPGITRKIIEHLSREMGFVGSAQMLDMYLGAVDAAQSESTREEIINLYRYKTGRYTIALPLSSGARLAGASENEISGLERIGEELGIIFQIKDDELDLFGSSTAIGKPVGSDIRSGKKTLLYTQLYRQVPDSVKEKLHLIFGNQNSTDADIQYIRDLLEHHNVLKETESLVDDLKTSIASQLLKCKIPNREQYMILSNLIEYSINRTS